MLFYNKIGEGEPLLILHGIFGSGDNWATLARQLAEENNLAVYLVDQRNHGRSPHFSDFSYDLMVADLLELIVSLGLEQISILGHSMGGKVAMKFALKYPKYLKKLIVVDMALRSYSMKSHEQLIAALLNIQLDNFKSRKEVEKALMPNIPDFSTRQFLMKNLYRTENKNFAWRLNLPIIAKKMSEISDASVSKENIFEKPSLFFRGGKSKYIQSKDYKEISTVFPNASIINISEAGHWIHADQPKTIFNYLKVFLENEH